MKFLTGLAVALCLSHGAPAQTIHGRSGFSLPPPPEAAVQPVVDNYFGTKVTDNYRWLEDGKSAETRAFIDAENTYTDRYMKQARIRPQVVDDLAALEQVTQWSLPIQREDNYYFLKRLPGEDQASIYIRRGWTGKDQRLIDPAVFSRDPNTSVNLADVSRDGTLVAYEVRQGGADETTVHIYNIKTGKVLEDTLSSALYSSITFTPDGSGLYYTRTTRLGTLLYLHVLGTRSFEDKLLFGREFHGEALGPNDLFSASVTDDGRYLVVTIHRGVPARRVDIVFRDLKTPGSYFDILVWDMEARFSAIYARGAWYVETDYKAPMGCILKADPGILPDVWTKIVPESREPIADFSIVGNKIYVNRLADVQSATSVYTLEGKPIGTVQYAVSGATTASVVQGRTTDRYGFFRVESFIHPPVIQRVDTVTSKLETFAQSNAPFDPNQFELKQVFFTSKDGTRIPIFIAGKKGLKQDGTERLLMTGYGGFNISMTPLWNPAYAWWMQQGGWFALPNLRGGGEYGENWHEQGMFGKKQNVFDDWFAAAQYLIANKYTSPQHFAIMGSSNGGLLMGVAITQHPELFSAVVCGFPLLDMLRYQNFEQGSHWITEFGSADDKAQFSYLLKYSPYQNVKPHTAYPAVLFFTGENDTRVDPLHARKLTALLQASSSSDRPILLHDSLAGGHSAGISAEQHIQDDADQLTFLWTETGQPTVRQ
jgi:prolyl oligopeptidase